MICIGRSSIHLAYWRAPPHVHHSSTRTARTICPLSTSGAILGNVLKLHVRCSWKPCFFRHDFHCVQGIPSSCSQASPCTGVIGENNVHFCLLDHVHNMYAAGKFLPFDDIGRELDDGVFIGACPPDNVHWDELPQTSTHRTAYWQVFDHYFR